MKPLELKPPVLQGVKLGADARRCAAAARRRSCRRRRAVETRSDAVPDLADERRAERHVNLGDHVQAFLIDARGLARSDALYVIEMGSNDIRDAIVAYQVGGSPAAQAVLAKALTAIAHNMQLLYGAGARHFLVWLPPNVALTPALRYLDRVSPGVATLGKVGMIRNRA